MSKQDVYKVMELVMILRWQLPGRYLKSVQWGQTEDDTSLTLRLMGWRFMYSSPCGGLAGYAHKTVRSTHIYYFQGPSKF